MSTLAVGDIVTIIHPNWRFTGKQGKIVEIINDGNEEGSIGVCFPKYYQFLFDHPDNANTVLRFEVSDLQKNSRDDKQDITVAQLCDMLFGSHMWHSIYVINQPLMIGFSDCMLRGCDSQAIMRIMLNCHGTVSEVDVCREHLGYHGCNADGLAFKKQAGSSTVNTDKLLAAIQG